MILSAAYWHHTAVPISMARAMATDSECIEKYFDLLEETLKQNKILIIHHEFLIVMKQEFSLAPKVSELLQRLVQRV